MSIQVIPSADHTWYWKTRPQRLVGSRFEPIDRKGQACAVVARGALGSILVMFADGYSVITSRHAVRRRCASG